MPGELSDITSDVVCFPVTKCQNKAVVLEWWHRLLSSLGNCMCVGVLILIHRRWLQSTIFCRTSDRLLFVDLTLNERHYTILLIYAPRAGYSVNDFNSCFDDLRQLVLEGQKIRRECLVGGDFNSDVHRGWRGTRLL